MLCKDGREIPVEVTRSQLALDSGSWVVAAIRDVSAQRETEKARADAELRFRVAFENNMAPQTHGDDPLGFAHPTVRQRPGCEL